MARQQTTRPILVALAVVPALLAIMLMPVATATEDSMLLYCDMLPTTECAFSVDSDGKRCVLETLAGGMGFHVCQTSDVTVGEGAPVEYMETDKCINACGLTEMILGVSSDALGSEEFMFSLCSSNCQQNCPNIVDLFSNLAFGAGKSLKTICTSITHAAMEEITDN